VFLKATEDVRFADAIDAGAEIPGPPPIGLVPHQHPRLPLVIDFEPLIIEAGTNIVHEGNRLAALRLLSDPDLRSR
jgi:hypothetical protein